MMCTVCVLRTSIIGSVRTVHTHIGNIRYAELNLYQLNLYFH